jgi:hypothetical protein
MLLEETLLESMSADGFLENLVLDHLAKKRVSKTAGKKAGKAGGSAMPTLNNLLVATYDPTTHPVHLYLMRYSTYDAEFFRGRIVPDLVQNVWHFYPLCDPDILRVAGKRQEDLCETFAFGRGKRVPKEIRWGPAFVWDYTNRRHMNSWRAFLSSFAKRYGKKYEAQVTVVSPEVMRTALKATPRRR